MNQQIHFYPLNTGLKYNSLPLLLSRNALQIILDTFVKQARFTLCMIFLFKSWKFLYISSERTITFLYPSSATLIPS